MAETDFGMNAMDRKVNAGRKKVDRQTKDKIQTDVVHTK